MLKRYLDFNFSSYQSNILKLMSSTILAQLIPFIISPVLTRLYSPEDFGIYGTLSAIIMLLTIFSTGKYELALNLPENKKELHSLIILIIFLSVTTCLLIIITGLVIDLNQILNFENKELELTIVLIICISILINGINLCFRYYSNRNKNFSTVAKSHIVNSLSAGISKLGLGFAGLTTLSLNIGDAVGSIVGMISYISKYGKNALDVFRDFDLIYIKSVAKKYQDFPLFQTLNSAVVRMVSYAPILIFSHFYGIAIVGFYELSIRILNRPLVIFTTSVTDVFREEVVKEKKESGSAKSIFLKTASGLLFLSIIPFAILYFYAENLFSLVFGNEWMISGSIARSLIPMYWSRFIISPLSYLFTVANKQREAAIWNTVISFVSVTILLIGSSYKIDITQTLFILSITYLTYYILLFFRAYKIA